MGATAAIGIMAGGSGYSAFGSHQAGKAQQKLANMNADIAEQQAQDALAVGRETEHWSRIGTRQTIGSQRASFGAQGVDVNDGSAADVQADAAYLGELDALTIRANAARTAWGYRVGAEDMRYRGVLAKHEGDTKAVGTILSTAGKMAYDKYGFGSTTRGKK